MKYETETKEEIGWKEMIEEGSIIAYIYCMNEKGYVGSLEHPYIEKEVWPNGKPSNYVIEMIEEGVVEE